MRLIKKCPSCNKILRFPIDKGKIKIKCSCGFSFLADPDDPFLYKDGEIDVSLKKKERKKRKSNFIKNLLDNCFNFYYQLLNFKIISFSDKIKVIIKIFIIIIISIVIIYFIISRKSAPIIL